MTREILMDNLALEPLKTRYAVDTAATGNSRKFAQSIALLQSVHQMSFLQFWHKIDSNQVCAATQGSGLTMWS